MSTLRKTAEPNIFYLFFENEQFIFGNKRKSIKKGKKRNSLKFLTANFHFEDLTVTDFFTIPIFYPNIGLPQTKEKIPTLFYLITIPLIKLV